METRTRINELAAILNRSTDEFLNAWNQATESWSTQADRDRFAALVAEKAKAADELHDLLCRI